MTSATRNKAGRAAIMVAVRNGLGRGELGPVETAELKLRMKNHRAGPIPERAKGTPEEIIARFEEMATMAACSVVHVTDRADIPEQVAAYLRDNNLPNQLVSAPEPWLEELPWSRAPMLERRAGASEDADLVSLTPAYAAVAETGTLIMTSSENHPTTLNFTPDTHIVALFASQIVGGYEDVWTGLRKSQPKDRQGRGSGIGVVLPRTVNMITGPSRTGDIGLIIELGAHGPRSLHIIIIDDTDLNSGQESSPESSPGRGPEPSVEPNVDRGSDSDASAGA